MSSSRTRTVPASTLLEGLLRDAPGDTVTLGWLVRRMGRRSFGLVLLLLGVLALLPAINIVAGLLLIIPAMQLIRGRAAPVFPRRIAARALPVRPLAALIRRVVPVLRAAERVTRDRPIATPLTTSRLTGAMTLVLAVLVAGTPIPFGNIPFAAGVILVALAELEQDGVVLALVLGTMLLAFGALLTAVVWTLLA
jgi:hypothetical protein